MTLSMNRTNSWHWLLMAMAVSLLIAVFSCLAVGRKAREVNGPRLQEMRTHADELMSLREEDAQLAERQAAEVQRRLVAYQEAVREKAGQPIPEGVQSVGVLGNEINRSLLKYRLRVVEQEQQQQQQPESAAAGAAAPAGVRRAAAAGQPQPKLPFETREIRYVVEGEYKYMFMFLVSQSRLKPSYHFKDIKISPSPGEAAGMRMEFTVQIHFKGGGS